MYRTLLVPVDPAGCAEEVVAHAGDVAAAFGAEVVLLHVIVAPDGVPLDTRLPSVGPAYAHLVEAAETELRRLAAMLERRGVAVRVEVAGGDPVATVLSRAEAAQADLVVMGTHGRRGLRHLLLGSVAEAVVRRAPVPVLVVRAPPGTPDRQSDAWRKVAAERDG